MEEMKVTVMEIYIGQLWAGTVDFQLENSIALEMILGLYSCREHLGQIKMILSHT